LKWIVKKVSPSKVAYYQGVDLVIHMFLCYLGNLVHNKVDTLNNIVDSLTKFVSIEKFSWCREAMGIVSLV
jgi:hypothetical protein